MRAASERRGRNLPSGARKQRGAHHNPCFPLPQPTRQSGLRQSCVTDGVGGAHHEDRRDARVVEEEDGGRELGTLHAALEDLLHHHRPHSHCEPRVVAATHWDREDRAEHEGDGGGDRRHRVGRAHQQEAHQRGGARPRRLDHLVEEERDHGERDVVQADVQKGADRHRDERGAVEPALLERRPARAGRPEPQDEQRPQRAGHRMPHRVEDGECEFGAAAVGFERPCVVDVEADVERSAGEDRGALRRHERPVEAALGHGRLRRNARGADAQRVPTRSFAQRGKWTGENCHFGPA
eukprot:1727442-Prymnesium_polylepis.1